MQVAISGDANITVTGKVAEVSGVPLSDTEATSGIESEHAAYELYIAEQKFKAPIPAGSKLTEGAVYSGAIPTQFLRPAGILIQVPGRIGQYPK